MLLCRDCHKEFEYADAVYNSVPYGDGTALEEFSECPFCGSDDICEARPCKSCGQPIPEDEDMCRECENSLQKKCLNFRDSIKNTEREYAIDFLEGLEW